MSPEHKEVDAMSKIPEEVEAELLHLTQHVYDDDDDGVLVDMHVGNLRRVIPTAITSEYARGIEAAAKVCRERQRSLHEMFMSNHDGGWYSQSVGAEDCAQQVEALLPKRDALGGGETKEEPTS